MRAVVQRVKKASVTINGSELRQISAGLLVLLGVHEHDTLDQCEKLAYKCANLRIFDDENGKLNISAAQNGYEIMVVSNFTLYGDTKKGNRPSFTAAAKPDLGLACYNEFVSCMRRQQGLASVQTGEFGADMQIELVNDGPITLILNTDEWAAKSQT